MPFRPFLKSHWLQFHCKNRHYACAVLVFSRTLATKTTRLRAQKLASEAAVPTQAKERAKTEEETVSSMSQRLVLVGVDWSLQVSQNQKSRKSRDLAKIDHLDLCENHLGCSLVENLSKNGPNSDERDLMVNENFQKGGDQQQVGSSRVGRFSVQSAGGLENWSQKIQPRAPVGRGLRELSPGSNPVNHSCNKANPEFSSLNLGGKPDNAFSRHLSIQEPPLPKNLSLCRKNYNKPPKSLQEKKSLGKFSYKEPKSRQEFSSYFLHFATPRPFYRAYSFI